MRKNEKVRHRCGLRVSGERKRYRGSEAAQPIALRRDIRKDGDIYKNRSVRNGNRAVFFMTFQQSMEICGIPISKHSARQ